MKTLIVYSSLTGNTRQIAEAIHPALGAEATLVPIEQAPTPDDYDMIALGFWVDRGGPDKKSQEYLKKLSGKQVILFATLGADPLSDHARDSIARAALLLSSDNTLIGSFICQGRVNPKLLESFKNLPADHPHAITPERQERHRKASLHPNEEDCAHARQTVQDMLEIAAAYQKF